MHKILVGLLVGRLVRDAFGLLVSLGLTVFAGSSCSGPCHIVLGLLVLGLIGVGLIVLGLIFFWAPLS